MNVLERVNDIERQIVTIALLAVFLGGLIDYYDDITQGATIIELILDTILNVFILGVLFYIWKKRPYFTQKRNRHLEQVLKRSNQDVKRWQEKASELLRGLGAKIDEQLNEWYLTQAEKEVALLLIKGLSIRELAEFRGTSEKTVRQQASQVYAKANLENRAELAAFFLEDLLLP